MPNKAGQRRRTRRQNGGLILAGVPRVNLLPSSELERRASVSLGKRWLVGLLATAVVVTSVVAGAHWMRTAAVAELITEQDRTLALNAELAGFAEVSQVLGEDVALTKLRSEAMGNDTDWRRFFATLLDAVPAGAELRDFNLVGGANPVEGGDPSTAIGLIGRLTLASGDPQDLVRFVQRLRALDLTLSADAGSLSSAEEDGYLFVVEFVLDQSNYSGDFSKEEAPQ